MSFEIWKNVLIGAAVAGLVAGAAFIIYKAVNFDPLDSITSSATKKLSDMSNTVANTVTEKLSDVTNTIAETVTGKFSDVTSTITNTTTDTVSDAYAKFKNWIFGGDKKVDLKPSNKTNPKVQSGVVHLQFSRIQRPPSGFH